jgi:RNA polymerase sigma factor (sigma-70 family)
MHKDSFWREQNTWWRTVALKMVAGAVPEDWTHASEQLWYLSWKVPEAHGISREDRQDLVQVVLLKLQDKDLCRRLAEIDAPAHYLARVMGNFLLDELDNNQAMRRAFERYAELSGTPKDNRPDALAAWNDLQACARYVVNHEMLRRDRIALWGWARGHSIEETARALGCSSAHASVILFRAKKKLEEAFRKNYRC